MAHVLRYFAYGSNINISQMAERNVPWLNRQAAILSGFALVFNKRGVRYPGYSVANIEKQEHSFVEGVIYEFPDEGSMRQLDTFEVGYDKRVVSVRLQHDSTLCTAVVYVARPEFVVNDLPPSQHYFQRIIEGGKDIFSEEYTKLLLNKQEHSTV